MVIRHFFIGFAFIAALLIPARAWTDPKFSVEVHPNYGTMDDAYIFSVILENGEDASGPPLLSGGADFSLSLIGPQSSVRIINGAVTRKMIYNYQLIPKKEGILTTPSAEVTLGGSKITAEALSVTVKGARSVDQPSQSKDYFMRQSLDTSERVFVGQQIAHTLEIFTKVTILDPQLGDFTFPDFRNEQIGTQETGARYVNGTQFTVTILRRALFPLKPGAVDIPSRELRAKVRVRDQQPSSFPFDTMDPFNPSFVDDFFNQGKVAPITLKSNPLKVEVDPLPPVPADLPLLGLDTPPVGPTTIKLQFDPREIKFGETKTAVVTVSSTGLIQSLKSLGTASTPALKIYEESPQTRSKVEGNKLWTTKIVKLSLVPLGGGEVAVPPFAIGYFDPDTKTFALAKTDPIRFNVTGAPPPPTAVPEVPRPKIDSNHGSQAPASGVESPLAYSEPTFAERLGRMISLPLALLVAATVIAIVFAVWVGLRVRAAFAPKRRSAELVAGSQSVEELSAAIRAAVQRRYPVLQGNFTRDELRGNIPDKDLLYAIETLLDRCDSALFGGRELKMELLRQDALSLIKKL